MNCFADGSTFLEVLLARAGESPDRLAFEFLSESGEVAARLGRGELGARARAVAARLQSLAAADERAVLLYPPGLEFICGFLGCLLARTVAVPAYPPRSQRGLGRLLSITGSARPRVVLTTSALLPRMASWMAQVPALRDLPIVATDALYEGEEEAWRRPDVAGGTLAFLQYTSGSTAAPKGVRVTHANLLHNEESIRRAFGYSASSVIVSWLPLYHDLGLIGGVLQSLYVGASCVLMSPVTFLQQPRRWLEAIHRWRATVSGGPNFAYELCLHRIPEEKRAGLDLSSWEVAVSGAEPVRAETLERFAAAFAPCGFRRRCFCPCYGLAEATLFVSGGAVAAEQVVCSVSAAKLESNRVVELGGEGARRVVGCGGPWLGQELAIADPATGCRASAGQVGEIWVSGPSVSEGYWDQPEATAHEFDAVLAGEPESGPFLRTGDLGFLLGGELYVTGRQKDLVIVRGRNLYPHDIEAAAERAHPSLRPGSSAAFAWEAEGENRLVLVCEVERSAGLDLAAVASAVRGAVADEHEVSVFEVVLLRAGMLPKTSSGKVRRGASAAGYREGTLTALFRSAKTAEGPLPASTPLPAAPEEWAAPVAALLRREVARVTRSSSASLDPAQPLTALGIDSLGAVELQQALAARFAVSVSPSELLEGLSLDGLAGRVLAGLRSLPEPELQEVRDRRESAAAPPAPAGAAAEPAKQPLSHGQRALWFLHRLAPRSAAYHLAAAARVLSPLDPDALERACHTLAARHPALRTTFQVAAGEPYQQVAPEAAPGFFREEVTGEEGLAARLLELADLPFDLAAGPLLRVTLLSGGLGGPVLLLVIHHAVADFWSLAVMVRELGELYAAERRGVAAALAPLPLRYSDHVRQERARMAGAEGERLWEHWRERLAGAPPDLPLPTDRPPPGVPTYRGGARALRLGPPLAQAVRSLARSRGVTLFSALLAVFQVLLHRQTGQDDLLVGSPTAGRGRSALAGLVGYFVNPVVLRCDLSGDPAVADLLPRVQAVVLAALAHGEFPFPLLAERLRPRDGAARALFRVMFALQSAPRLDEGDLNAFALGLAGDAVRAGGLELTPLPRPETSAAFDLALWAAELGPDLGVSLRYSSDVFDSTTAGRLLGQFCRLLAGAAARPEARLSDLPLLGWGERWQLVGEWNDTACRDSGAFGARGLPGLVECQAARTPGAVALTGEGETLSYRELNRRANRLAHRLRGLGVGPDVPVGVCAERSCGLVVALLGILKAGGAYLPLAPDLPAARLALLIADAGLKVVLAPPELAGLLPAGALSIVWLEEGGEGVSGADPRDPLDGDLAAYVLYTSGSTGRPKGVVVSHAAICNRLLWMQAAYGLGPADRVLQKTPYTFDVSVWELFWPLITGARLVVARPGGHRDPTYLAGVIAAEAVTVVHFVPSLLQGFLEEPGAARCGSLSRAFTSGEALAAAVAERFFARFPEGVELENLYGPTEAAVDVTSWRCQREELRRSIPIGRPIANISARVLDRWSHPVPIGVAGELHLGGRGLARGYLGRPDLTAAAFVPDPFPAAPGDRVYRTGDLARVLPDGALDFLGRIDHQVKIRGVRIELGEIEAALVRHPAVREAVVLARQDGPGEPRLVAYVTPAAPAGGRAPDPGELRAFVAARLPEAMVPARLVILERLPLNPSGKVDRRALPAPDAGRPALERAFVAPRTPAERLLAEILADLLGLDRVGVEDSFDHLGGDSILGIQLVVRARQAGLFFTLHDLILHRTVAALAAAGAAPAGGVAGQEAAAGGEVPLTPIQRWFFARELPDPQHFNQAVMLEPGTRLDPSRLSWAVALLFDHHEALRLRFHRQAGGAWRQELGGRGVLPSLTHIDLGALAEERAAAALGAAAAALQRGFNLATGPLLRVVVFDLGAARPGRLLLAAHHLVIDGVSWRILLEDLEAAYRRAGDFSPLPPRTASYRRWSELLQERAGAPELARQADHWRQILATPVLPLPIDHPEGSNRCATAASFVVELDEAETGALLREIPRVFQTGADAALLAALALAWAGPHGGTLRVDLEGHGREELDPALDVSRTVGWFTTLFPVVLRVGGGPAATLRAVKEQLRAVPQSGIGFGLLCYLAADPALADLRRAAPAGVLFNYLGQFGGPADRGGGRAPLLRPAAESPGPFEGPLGMRHHVLELNVAVLAGRLRATWGYSTALHRRSTIARLAQRFLDALRALIDPCRGCETAELTSSDFSPAAPEEAGLARGVRALTQSPLVTP